MRVFHRYWPNAACCYWPRRKQEGNCTSHGVGITVDHYNDVIMGAIASQISSLTIVYSIVYSDADQRKHHSSASLAFVRGIHRGPANSPHKWPVTRKMFPFDDVSMWCPGNVRSQCDIDLNFLKYRPVSHRISYIIRTLLLSFFIYCYISFLMFSRNRRKL